MAPPSIYYASTHYISGKTRSSAPRRAYLWPTYDGIASWTVIGRQGGKVRNRRVAKSRIVLIPILILILLILAKKFVPLQFIRGCRYCFVNNTNKLRLLVSMCFWVEEGMEGRTNQVEKTLYTGSN